MQFVRDLQKATGSAGLENLDTVASKQLTAEFDTEKELSSQLRKQLRDVEKERADLLEKLGQFQGENKEVVVVQADGERKTFKVT